jgi:ribosomal protein L40E
MFLISQASGAGLSPVQILPLLLVLFLIGFLLYRIGQGTLADSSMDEEMVCRRCESVGHPDTELPGNTAFGCALLFFFIVPGILYAIWRRTNEKKVCRSCGSEDLVPTHSPAGERIIEKQKDEG